ncbi:MAG TPA: trypco2 family protein [Candidatus Nanoarchaeia archaeon]|nr:trypco2 family protein [Candidatus Nanoarchaeia archaeon]
MTEIPLETGSDIMTYIKNLKTQVKEGLGEDASLSGPIELEVSTTLEKSAGGGFFISVLKAGAQVKREEVHTIKIPIKLISGADKKEEEARIAEAEARKAGAEEEKAKSEHNTRMVKKGPWIA